jgi:hypothetical protein
MWVRISPLSLGLDELLIEIPGPGVLETLRPDELGSAAGRDGRGRGPCLCGFASPFLIGQASLFCFCSFASPSLIGQASIYCFSNPFGNIVKSFILIMPLSAGDWICICWQCLKFTDRCFLPNCPTKYNGDDTSFSTLMPFYSSRHLDAITVIRVHKIWTYE